MNKRTWHLALTAAAFVAIAAIIPFAQKYAAQQFGWGRSAQIAFGVLAVLPVLVLVGYFAKRLRLNRREPPAN